MVAPTLFLKFSTSLSLFVCPLSLLCVSFSLSLFLSFALVTKDDDLMIETTTEYKAMCRDGFSIGVFVFVLVVKYETITKSLGGAVLVLY